jgi:hypothetical protein
MKFELSESQVKKFKTWEKKKMKELKKENKDYIGAIGGHFSIEFMMTSIGVVVSANCSDGTTLDITEYENW